MAESAPGLPGWTYQVILPPHKVITVIELWGLAGGAGGMAGAGVVGAGGVAGEGELPGIEGSREQVADIM